MKQYPLLVKVETILKAEEDIKDGLNDLEKSESFNQISLKVPVVKDIVKNQIEKNKTIQSCIIYETVLIATLAEKMGLKLIESNGKERYAYSNEDRSITLYQYGDPNHHDCVLDDNGTITNIEIKKPYAKAGEIDLKVDEDGYPVYSEKFDSIINAFFSQINILENLGHNVKIDDTYSEKIFNDYSKEIDKFLTTTEEGNNIAILDKNEMSQYISFKGSEIRTTGRNWVKKKTLERYLKNKICLNGYIENDICFIAQKDISERTIARGKKIPSSWRKIFGCFRVKDQDIISENEDYLQVPLGKIEQNKPTASAHLTINIKEQPND